MKVNLRKGIFETSSSSEDSLSVYQEMKLYILPKDIYNNFLDGKIWIKFDGIRPHWCADAKTVEEKNKIPNKEYHVIEFYNNQLWVNPLRVYYYLDSFYINYETYSNMLGSQFSDYNGFEYEDGDNIIFGFYGYTEE